MTLKEIGEETRKFISVKVCGLCDCIIDDSGLCSYGCNEDGSLNRPPKMTIVRTYQRIDKLVEQKII